MNVVYVLLPLAVLFAVGALYVFIRAVRAGQFDDLDTPAVRMLHDDEEHPDNDDGAGPARPSARASPRTRSRR